MPANSPIWKGGPSAIAEAPDSPVWEWGEYTVCTQTFYGTHAQCIAAKVVRGTAGTGGLSGLLCEQSAVYREKGGKGRLVIRWRSADPVEGGAGLPSGTARGAPVELNPRLERHSRYGSLTDLEREQVKAAYEGATQEERDKAYASLGATGQELVGKMRKGTENFYQAGIRYMYSYYAASLSGLSVGGSIEVPGGPAAAALSGFACLRLADEFEQDGDRWRITVTYLCAPAGHWDTDIY